MALSTTVRRERERANERDANAKMREDALSVPRRTDGGRATTQMARDADSFFRDVFRDADDVRTRSRAWGGRGRRTREGSSVRRLVSTRLVSSRLVSSRARARSDARYFLSRKKLDQKGHQNDLMTLLVSSGTRVEMD
jgi:hypothetical protein